MDFIQLKVTSKVIAQTEKSVSQEQITIVKAPENYERRFLSANKNNYTRIIISSVLHLSVGDTHAIWGAHNTNSKDFENLYNLLSKYPDKTFDFGIEVV